MKRTINQELTTANYPYGFAQKTTAIFKLEFNTKKGTRLIFQTINPKTGRANAPKKETYINGLQYLEQDENGIIKSHCIQTGNYKTMFTLLSFLKDNPELLNELTEEQKEYYCRSTYCTVLYFIEWTEGSQNIFQALKEHLRISKECFKSKNLGTLITYFTENIINLDDLKEKHRGEPVAKSFRMTVQQLN